MYPYSSLNIKILLLVFTSAFFKLNGQELKNSVSFSFGFYRPISNFSYNLNTELLLSPEVSYSRKISSKIALQVNYNYCKYGESVYSNLYLYNVPIAIRQKSITTAFFHGLSLGINYQLPLKSNRIKILPVFFVGLNNFIGKTKFDRPFYTWDTNNNGVLDGDDIEIDPKTQIFGAAPSLPKNTDRTDINYFNPFIGLGFEAKIRLVHHLYFNTRFTYQYSFRANYFNDSSNIEEPIFSSRDKFIIVSSPVMIFTSSAGFSYDF